MVWGRLRALEWPREELLVQRLPRTHLEGGGGGVITRWHGARALLRIWLPAACFGYPYYGYPYYGYPYYGYPYYGYPYYGYPYYGYPYYGHPYYGYPYYGYPSYGYPYYGHPSYGHPYYYQILRLQLL